MTFLHYAELKGRATCIRQTQVNLYQRPGLLQKNFLEKGENLDGQMSGFLQIVIHRLMKFRISIFPFLMGISLPLLGEGINFEKEILPILQDRCIECHKAPYEKNDRLYKPKAGLRMDGVAHLMFGSDDGPVLVPNHPSKSPLYSRVVLPLDDDDHMPPKGDPLTLVQQDLIRQWIGQGADFGSWVGATDGIENLVRKEAQQDELIPAFVKFYQELGKEVEPAQKSLVEEVKKKTGLLIRPIGKNSPLLEARVVTRHEHVGDKEVLELSRLDSQVVKLDLRNTSISNEACKTISKFGNLIELNIMACKISDGGVVSLSSLKKLQNLNVGHTQLGHGSFKKLTQMTSLEKLNVWGCEELKNVPDLLGDIRPGLNIVN